ncbi:ATP-binding protein, partial [Frankia sp. AgKG'84/4]|uniref:ATP-binding protein n=1 Tax=Frankia sp. AgKG'84/4 TaxID=573490 RepID=UPI00202AA8AE
MVSFPLAAVVGMDDLRLALLLNAVDPTLGGVLVRGEKGTAKTTAVRGLAALLAPVDVLDGCRFACAPHAPNPHCPDGPHPDGAGWTRRPVRLVELPVGASEDRITGALDLDRALADGVSVLRPGLLAAAHRGILYVDEINLLGDHLVDLLLDAAATGVAHVERDGVSARHPARFLLVGTMNPEEGELRPQLLDRFALTVRVAASREPATRAQVVRRRLAHDRDPQAFAAHWEPVQRQLTDRVAAATARLPAVTLSDRALDAIATVCARCDVDGMRADVVLARTAMAHAAWSGHTTVRAADLRVGARLALPHRRRRGPFDAPDLDGADLDAILDDALAGLDDAVEAERSAARHAPPGQDRDGDGPPDDDSSQPPADPDGTGPQDDGGPGSSPAQSGPGGGHSEAGHTHDDADSRPAVGTDPTAPGTEHGPPAAGTEGTSPAGTNDPNLTGTDPAGGGPTGSQHGGPRTPPRLVLPHRGAANSSDQPATTGAHHTPTPGALFRPRTLTVTGLGASATPGRRSAAHTSRGTIVTTSADAPGLHLPAT